MATVWCSSRKCACRRESNSHDAAKPRMPARRHALARGRQSTRGRQQPDFSQGRRERRPVQTHEDAARGDDRTRQRASGKLMGARMKTYLRQCCSISSARTRSWHQEFKVVVRVARRRAPCTVSGARRRRGVPRLLLPWRGAGSRIPRMQMHHCPPAARTDA